ncbi:hypothetical protein ACIRON_24315 [Nocardioides sp. NPDC101246]|uniref:hypothetical protein n=1 Tax=Nocardioides sp. NPDC101246 TaxID=3364336 RepID=UPI00381B0E84
MIGFGFLGSGICEDGPSGAEIGFGSGSLAEIGFGSSCCADTVDASYCCSVRMVLTSALLSVSDEDLVGWDLITGREDGLPLSSWSAA